MNTPSEVGGVLARIADGLPRTPDAEGYRRLLTWAANHLLPLAHPPSDLRHAINSRRDARSSINASRERRHENEVRRREEYDRDHGVPARSQATRVELATASTGGTTRGRSRHHDNNSPPRDRHHHRRQEDTCGVSALTPHLRAIQWPPNFKVSNVDKYEPKQDPGGRLAVYTTTARAAGATEDVMTAYLPIVLGQDALQWLRHLPQHCIDDWSDFSRCFIANFQSLSDKPAQPWDLKSIKLRGDETLRSYLKRFQTMKNRIPEVAEAAVIEDFYRDPMTQPSSEPYCRRRRLPPSSYSGKRTSTSPPTNELRTSSEEHSLHQRHRDTTRTNNPTNVGRKGLVKKSTPPDHPPLAPEEHPAEANVHWTTSSTPNAHTTRTCATPSGTAGTSSTPLGTTDPSNLYHLPTSRRTRRTSTASTTGRGRRRSIPARRWRSQRHLWQTWVARKQEATEAQRPSYTGGDHQSSRSVSMV
jgi:hypothetical protein